MRPKGKLLALVAMFAAVGLITATGAFTTVEAERTATVDVAGDSSALLQLTQSENMGGTGDVSENAGDGQIEIDLSDSALGDADGLNPNANTTITPMFNVTNQGTNTVELTIDIDDESSDIELFLVDDEGTVVGNTATLTEGQEIEYGLKISTGDDLSEFNIDITFTADAQ